MSKVSKRLNKTVCAFKDADSEAYFKHFERLEEMCHDDVEAEDFLYGVLAEDGSSDSHRKLIAQKVLDLTWIQQGDNAAYRRALARKK